ncbi:MAG TPA: LrgB family protein [Candidatus Limnocylindria bacterium]|jgi:putative effector of murein hydrolase|nr:LrgB family protein [Candidatus Limnocylindria bacterium]
MALLALALTLGVWFLALRVPRIPPIVTTAVVLAVLVPALHLQRAYGTGTEPLVLLLAPAVVALALPLYRERLTLLRSLAPSLVGIVAGSAAALVAAAFVGRAFGLSDTVIRALAPRTATSPVAASIASTLGADPHLAAAAAVAGGVLGALLAPLALRLAGDPRHTGLGLGVAANGVGTARAAALHPQAGASAAAAMALNALITALLAPLLLPLVLH